MYKSIVYEGDKSLGEVEVYPQNKDNYYQNKEIRISHYSKSSERCSPLAVLYTITANATSSYSGGFCFKMESKSQSTEMHFLHSSCIRENKTAIILLEGDELHLVAMPSRNDDGMSKYFWGFRVPQGLYSSCLAMLNLRCLGIVFDLDETLIVANTMRSFEDKIDALQRKLKNEKDPLRINGMLAEIKRYQDDKSILKQYSENDQVVENGTVIKSKSEVVPALSENYPSIVRPIIRLQDKNIILTRINPQIRDTSVLVRLRPAWEGLRSYLMARERKRFKVFVCTMAKRDYALEMWRLLDPYSKLISSKQLLDSLVCVKSGSRKSLLNVFQNGNCHPKMALIIDDRLNVWDEKDQDRVHVVPPFSPYYAPQAEANNAIPVLCVARNVACNVRGGFFKNFDDDMLRRISELMFEDDIKSLPFTPDVSNYLISEVGFDGMADVKVKRCLKEVVPAPSTLPLSVNSQDPRFASLQFANPPPPIILNPQLILNKFESALDSSSATEEGEIPESEVDPDTKRRLLILQHGHDSTMALPRYDQMRQNYSMTSYNSFPDFARALQDIAAQCGTKVEFRSAVVPSMELQFSVEILFAGEKVGGTIGRTRREAQRQAAEISLLKLAEKYLSCLKPDSVPLNGKENMFYNASEIGFVGDVQQNRLKGSKKSVGSNVALEELDADKALGNLPNMLNQFSQKRQGSQREFGMSNKRPKARRTSSLSSSAIF